MNLIGKIIGNRYEILEEAGIGGMAMVYKAKDRILNRMVAVKVLKDEYTTDSDFIKRFKTEAQSAAGLTHPNIVSIYDVGHEEENNLYYIVMELIKGKTLKNIIKKDKVLSWKWAVNIAIQIASALELAHKNGIVHRDIKPHNIIITEDGTAKVTDFGIAKAVSNSTITSFGTTIGSVHYFSPEQAKGSITDAKSDLYSLGVVLYEMLTGEVPFDADTPVSVALKHMQEEPEPPININEDIPTAINDIVVKAMQKDPINRYQSATEMLADLSKALKDPDGDFVIIENKDGGYTRIMNAVKDDDVKRSKSHAKKGYFAQHPKTKIAVIILGLILLFVVVFLITKLVLDGEKSKKIDIPNLSGMTQEEAKTKIEELNKNEKSNIIVEIEEQASDTVEKGKIISQEPMPGAHEGSVDKIKIIISKGPETTELPDYKDKDIKEVRESTKKLGLKLTEKEENSDSVQEGKVISQDTKAGTLVKSGDELVVHVSLGVKKTQVPTVVDMDEGTAKATLSNANLKANVTYTNDSSKSDGKVISQSIEQGKEVAEGTTIDIVVNKIEVAKKTLYLKLFINIGDNIKVKDTSDSSKTKSVDVELKIKINGTEKIEKTQKETIDLTKDYKLCDIGKVTGNGIQNVFVEILRDGIQIGTAGNPIDLDEDWTDGGFASLNYTLNSIN